MTMRNHRAAIAAAWLLFAGVLLALPAPAHGQADVALVYRLMLDQRMVVTRGAAVDTAVLGGRLANDDAVFTSENTRAAIRFTDDGSLLRLNPNSQLRIQAAGDRGALVKTIELEFGELWSRVTRGDAQQLRVQTPSGVAAVKGTEFIVRVSPDGVTTVATLEGIVEFANQGGVVDITAGNIVIVQSPADPPVPRPITAGDIGAFDALLDDADADEPSTIEITLQHPDGRTRTVLLEVPRRELRTFMGWEE
jgi:ferric-dicitrate binding protein FerR (iron transport regulator)